MARTRGATFMKLGLAPATRINFKFLFTIPFLLPVSLDPAEDAEDNRVSEFLEPKIGPAASIV